MLERIKALANASAGILAEWRHDFHAHPELSFEEVETTSRIKARLEEIGFSGMRIGTAGIPTGLSVDLNPGKPGPCFALRADIDALPMKETGNPPYKSQNEGIMHACGQDS